MSSPEFVILEQDEIKVNRVGFPTLEFTGRQLKEIAPDWTGTYSQYDIIDVDGEKLRILEIKISYPDEGDVTKYELLIGEYPA
jgi:hypothetical protein